MTRVHGPAPLTSLACRGSQHFKFADARSHQPPHSTRVPHPRVQISVLTHFSFIPHHPSLILFNSLPLEAIRPLLHAHFGDPYTFQHDTSHPYHPSITTSIIDRDAKHHTFASTSFRSNIQHHTICITIPRPGRRLSSHGITFP